MVDHLTILADNMARMPGGAARSARVAGGSSGTAEDPALSRPLSEVKAELFKALGHPARVRILEVLAGGERTVSELTDLVGIEASHLSQQLAVLRRARLVAFRKEGHRVRYVIADPEIVRLLAVAKQILVNSLSDTEAILEGLRSQ
jgi:DNA-binding transcriptional ArsR family regulator